MYSHHFGLTQDPFSIAPDPRYLFMSERHREALAHLLYGVAGPHKAAGGTGGGFVLLTGDIGTGKTTICRCFLEQIPAGCHVAYIFNPKLTVTELLQSICEEFHITAAAAASNPPTVKDYIDALNAFLLQSHAAGQSSVLIIDEAQNLESDVLEQLRLLTNLETNERKLLQIVLIGQPELRAMLARPELEQLAQRVIARFHLDALTDTESTQYIQHRLDVAGHTGPLPFDRQSLQRIHRLARGVPRRINLLCGRALLGAWANGLHRVDRTVVDKAAAEVFGPDIPRAPTAGSLPTAYALGGFALLAGAALTGFLMWPTPQKALPSPQAAKSAPPAPPAPQANASSPIRVESLVLNPVEEIEALLPQLPRDINAAWRELAPTWKLSANDGDPCQAAGAQQLQCYRTDKLTVPLLRQLGRPGILTLQVDNGPPAYALLVGLSDQTATLRVAASLHTVRLVSLGRLWRGDFATYWRPPPGYSADLRDGNAGPAIERLASQLSRLDGAPAPAASAAPPVLDAALRARVRAFQRAQGLKADGQPGPMTFMQIDSATDVNEPRLQTNPR
ncbi:MAG TPA: peptidoglycan-binding protein [Polaromonas sp.]|uniref:AAA family ATPase n=1 Tax=Polaromonas sp. UBA4122 TaxID=1947074 RepID=UPI000EE99B2E|nr:AAA family ATPase [Polaromonas sp. UBA4122]HAL39550.1 peptidoglycan-binding protein [Polaromonas sp.]